MEEGDLALVAGVLVDDQPRKQVQADNPPIDTAQKTPPMSFINLQHRNLSLRNITITSPLDPSLNPPDLNTPIRPDINLQILRTILDSTNFVVIGEARVVVH